mgnify:CR=1 FL=1
MTHKIAFLYEPEFVPPQIIRMAEERLAPGFELTLVETESANSSRRAAVGAADFIIGYPAELSPEELQSAAKLKLLQILSAGYEYLDLDSFRERHIPVANNGGANAPTVAEHAILLILAVFKKLPMHHNTLVDGVWLGAEETLRMRELRGKALGIVGFGRIGQEIARIAQGFQTVTIYNDLKAVSETLEEETRATYAPLDTLLRQSDVVTIHTALTPQNHGLINASNLALMKSSAIVINTARGPVIDEPALIEALQNGTIAGAGLDVFVDEPLGKDSPLVSLPNVVLTPHTAGITLDTWARRIEFGFSNIERVAAGEPPQSVIS